MGAPGIRLQGDARRLKAEEVYELHIKRWSNTKIAEEVDVSRKLVARLIEEESENQDSERKSQERQQAIATYDAVIRKAWEELADEGLATNSLNRSGYLNTIINAQKAIDAITGVQAPKEYRGSFTHEYIDLSGASEETVREIEEYLAALDS